MTTKVNLYWICYWNDEGTTKARVYVEKYSQNIPDDGTFEHDLDITDILAGKMTYNSTLSTSPSESEACGLLIQFYFNPSEECWGTYNVDSTVELYAPNGPA